jgi:hypothetical protein
MLELKRISHDAIARSLAKAERYRLLNEPHEAESICRDVLHTDPDNQEALVVLLLALTDQFGQRHVSDMKKAQEVLAQLRGEYERAYYAGIISERWAKAQLETGAPVHLALGWVEQAMGLYEQAEALSPAGNEDAVLRWNSCVRMIESHRLAPKAEQTSMEAGFGDEVPHHWNKPRR